MTTIITASPAPNTANELYEVKIKAADIRTLYPDLFFRIDKGLGGVKDIRIDQNVQTARFAWSDEKEREIERHFGVGPDEEEAAALPDISSLLVNGRQILELAKAAAARDWYNYANQLKGGLEGPLQLLYPGGSIDRIRFRIEMDGEIKTAIATSGGSRAPDFINLLSNGTRAFLLKQVNS